MTQLPAFIVYALDHVFTPAVSHSPTPLLIVAAYAAGSVVLYGLTRGREFLVTGYASVLFLVPFIRIS
ncbi:MAG TPA: hypothetical protein VF595_14430 [Tepidisphaeraceae bacterium]|jgi:hypothetical protein